MVATVWGKNSQVYLDLEVLSLVLEPQMILGLVLDQLIVFSSGPGPAGGLRFQPWTGWWSSILVLVQLVVLDRVNRFESVVRTGLVCDLCARVCCGSASLQRSVVCDLQAGCCAQVV